MNIKTILVSVFFSLTFYICAQGNLKVSPTPQSVADVKGTLNIPASVRITGKTSADAQALVEDFV